jgi:hypothetical protein
MKKIQFLFIIILINFLPKLVNAQAESQSRKPSAANSAIKSNQNIQKQQLIVQFETERLNALKNDGVIDSRESVALTAFASQNNDATLSNYFLARLHRNSTRSKEYLEKLTDQNNPLINAEHAWQMLSLGDYKEAKILINELKNSRFISNDKLLYGQLIKQSIEGNSFLITNGEWDTYAALSAVDRSVIVIPLQLLSHGDFQKYLLESTQSKIDEKQDLNTIINQLAKKRPVYISLTVHPNKLKPSSAQLTIAGVCVKWNPSQSKSKENEHFFQSAAFDQLIDQLKKSNSKDLLWYRNLLPGLKIYAQQLAQEKKSTEEIQKAIQLIQTKTAENE